MPTDLAWEIRGGSVKALTEQGYLAASGAVKHTGKANRLAPVWADNMTTHYDELALKEPVFGDLRNCMELAIVGALLVKENLPAKAGCSLATLMESSVLKTDEYPAPKQVDTQVRIMKGNLWLISASGGVAIRSWEIVGKTKKSDDPAKVRTRRPPRPTSGAGTDLNR